MRWPLLRLPLGQWRAHPWRHAMAMIAVALGVALAWSVHLINESALAEFTSAVRSVQGEPDLVLRGPREGFDDALFARVVLADGVRAASPVVEIETLMHAAASSERGLTIKLLGIDALRVAGVAPDLLPRPDSGADPLAVLDPHNVFVNAAALERLGGARGSEVVLRAGPAQHRFKPAGNVAAGGMPLAVIDIAAAQALFGFEGRLSRIDIRLSPGTDAAALLQRLALPPGVAAVRAGDDLERASNVSRAYRVNLTVLALVALFVGAFLVFSVTALSVAQRLPSLALLGVLGMDANGRRRMVLGECALIGLAGSTLGLLLGTALAAAALKLMAGDLGGGFFPGVQPALRWSPWAALVFALLGVLSAVIGGWVPALQARRVQPAQALKGLGAPLGRRPSAWPGAALMLAGGALAMLPPIAGLPIAAYAAVAALLFGGVAWVPWLMGLVGLVPPRLRGGNAVMRLAVARAHFHRDTASALVAGVVASLALSVAITVMVGSFRAGVADWLDAVLPADLYARSGSGGASADQLWMSDATVNAIKALPGVARVEASRTRALSLRADLPAVLLIARPLDDPARRLPITGALVDAGPGEVGVVVSEAVQSLYGADPGTLLKLPVATSDGASSVDVRVIGVWRDFARSFGAIVIDAAAYRRLTGDARVNDLAVWLQADASAAAVREAIRRQAGDAAPLEFATPAELRKLSLAIFDRSFAVTVYLQIVAVGIALVGIAASLSAQVLARRKEFGLLAHLGLTARQVTAMVAIEAGLSLVAGVAIGCVLGLVVSAVLVFVVNPQSFHWTMDLRVPWLRIGVLCAAVGATGALTAAWSARRAVSGDAVRAVKEDW